MIQISPEFEAVRKLCGPQQIQSNTEYRFTHFCVSAVCEAGTLIYHTLTGALYLLPDGTRIEAERETLIQNRFLVPEGWDERKYADQVRSIAAALRRCKSKNSFLILTTTDCNARCFYCYEKGCKHISMSPTVARDVAAYLIRMSGEEKLKLTWFGGEPLYNREAIEIICDELKKVNKPFRSTMVSNGYYLDPETAKSAYHDWNLKTIQITIDGTKEVYQRTKAYQERNPNAYERVLNNVRGAIDAGLMVRIRMNMDGNNAEDLFRLADELRGRFDGCKRIVGECSLLQELAGKVGAFSSEEEAARKCWELQKKLDVQWPGPVKMLPRELPYNCCMADNDACEVILPDGNVGRCERLDLPNVVGSIYSAERDLEQVKAWKETISFPECSTCPCYPQCINLRQCDWVEHGCAASRRLLKIWEIEEKMLSTYHQFIANQKLGG